MMCDLEESRRMRKEKKVPEEGEDEDRNQENGTILSLVP